MGFLWRCPFRFLPARPGTFLLEGAGAPVLGDPYPIPGSISPRPPPLRRRNPSGQKAHMATVEPGKLDPTTARFVPKSAAADDGEGWTKVGGSGGHGDHGHLDALAAPFAPGETELTGEHILAPPPPCRLPPARLGGAGPSPSPSPGGAVLRCPPDDCPPPPPRRGVPRGHRRGPRRQRRRRQDPPGGLRAHARVQPGRDAHAPRHLGGQEDGPEPVEAEDPPRRGLRRRPRLPLLRGPRPRLPPGPPRLGRVPRPRRRQAPRDEGLGRPLRQPPRQARGRG